MPAAANPAPSGFMSWPGQMADAICAGRCRRSSLWNSRKTLRLAVSYVTGVTRGKSDRIGVDPFEEPRLVAGVTFDSTFMMPSVKNLLHANISPSKGAWVGAGAGITGLSFVYTIRQHDAFVALALENKDDDTNRHLYEALQHREEEIEGAFGGATRLGHKREPRVRWVRKTFATGG